MHKFGSLGDYEKELRKFATVLKCNDQILPVESDLASRREAAIEYLFSM